MDHSSTGVAAENLRPGTAEWQIRAADPLQIEGYATASSVAAGETLGLCVNCIPGIVRFRIDYYRIGCYSGLGGRLVRSVDDLVAVRQPIPFLDRARWLAECDWSPSDEFVVPDDWCSGVYLAVLSTIPADPVDIRSSYVPFVVRDDKRPHQLVYQLPVATYHAYSAWPRTGSPYWNAGVTCGNLYGSSGPNADTRSFAVSLSRPLAQYWGSEDFFAYEYPLVHWLEREGYDVSYINSLDMDRGCPAIDTCRLFIVAGHDEYCSGRAREAVERLIARGISVAFMGANPLHWQTRYEGSAGDPNRRIICYKDFGGFTPASDSVVDPIRQTDISLTTARWRDPVLGRPECNVVGQMYTDYLRQNNTEPGARNLSYSATFSTPIQWPFVGTEIVEGTVVDGLIGGEVDYPFRPGDSWFGAPLVNVLDIPSRVILARSEVPAGSSPGSVTGCTTLYKHDSGALVFSAGSFTWSWSLADVHLPPLRTTTQSDPRIQRLTKNLFAALLASPPESAWVDRTGVLKLNGQMFLCEGPVGAAWNIVTGDVVSCALAGDRIAVLKADGGLYVKQGSVYAEWTPVAVHVFAYSITEERIAVLKNDRVLYVKEGALDAAWSLEIGDVVSHSISGNRIAVLKSDGRLFVKEGELDAPWIGQFENVKSFALAENRVALFGGDSRLLIQTGALDSPVLFETAKTRRRRLSRSATQIREPPP